ncbi:MAG TPA: serine hydrolase domain-containing protein [Thermoanaerobaculia bacterium]|nr:serine hydrolase domain-containing protein [Thermoanaerobaculia bacterium]
MSLAIALAAGLPGPASAQPPDEPPAPAGPPLSQAEALAALEKEIRGRSDDGRFSGVVLVAKDGKVVLTRAVGLAQREHETPMREDTRFNLGSINKAFTRVAILQLVEAGKIDLDAPFARYWPDYPDPEIAAKVTVRQLVDMQSGLPDIFNERFAATPRDRLRSLADYLQLFTGQPLDFEPGTQRRYSSAGYVVLGLLIERLSGQTYYDYVRRHIFAPAGMTSTDSYALDEIVPGRATGYTRRQGGRGPGEARHANTPDAPLRANYHSLPARGSSAGGGYSTARDLLAFGRALRAGKVVESDFWRRNGGLGVAGGAPGINALLEDDWVSGWTVIVLANLDPPAAEELGKIAIELVGRVR